MFYTSQRIALSASEFNAVDFPSEYPIDDTSHTGTTLDLSSGLNDSQAITITVLADGNLHVTGTLSGDNSPVEGWENLTTIIGNPLANITLVAPNVDNVWDLNGINAGFLTPNSLGTITFSDVQNLTGGTQNDTYIIDTLAGVTGSIDEGGGPVELQLFDFYISGTFSFGPETGDLRATATPSIVQTTSF